ncbi:hypothetical protein AB0D10_03670 [Kitasatospora sp. NPDC048545]|uniref:hypothetical protein n=1 Tax=Kitasatospora sp. NPDC048545 TaxID=3157208 RepID=UPI0033D8D0EA
MTTRTTTAGLAGAAIPVCAVTAGAAVIQHDEALAIVGLIFAIVGAAAMVTRIIHAAVTDTAIERRRLHLAEEHAASEYARYIAARAIVDADAERLCREAADIEARSARRLAEERERLQLETEATRGALKREGYRIGFAHGQRGIAEAHNQPGRMATIIPLPAPSAGSDPTLGSGHLS